MLATTPATPQSAPQSSAPQSWTRTLAAYREPSVLRSLVELAVTAGPLLLIVALSWAFHARGWWGASLALSLPAGAFLLRMFMIQHDCGHGSFFRDKRANDWLGRAVGVLTLTPYGYWRHTHAVHHASSGDLDRRTLGAIEMMTVAEYRAMPRLQRLGYRLYRHPLTMFGVGPAYMFLLQQRLPIGMMKAGWAPWISAMGTNLAVVALVALALAFGGAGPLLLTYLPAVLLAASVGVWLFYVQHQFETTYWARRPDWRMEEAALEGSSHYDLPPVLRWITANIGLHHIHHVSSRIPYYRLREALIDHPELEAKSRLTLGESLRCVPLTLWDEETRRLVSFRQATRLAA